MKYVFLDSQEEELLKRHQRTFPVKVAALAHALGLSVREVDMADDVSGSLSKESNGWTIRVNRRHARVRQRFTVAHEIAHYLLHRDKIKLDVVDDAFYRSSLSDKTEREANSLAAEILMPWQLIKIATDQGSRDPETLAKTFEVSETAMSIRLGLNA
jgi:Zn-dependent peptidase ImmA (M78 family)